MGEPDYTNFYNTPLTPEQEAQFVKWAQSSGRARDTYDYDLRGAWKDDIQAAANGHLPDTYKKPNHPTFSAESIYHGADGQYGGEWAGDDKTGWVFKASPLNTANYANGRLQDYFRRVEPDAKLVMPKPLSDRMYPSDVP